MYQDDYRSFRVHLQDPHGPHHIISVKNNSQISGKMLDFRYPLSTKYGVRCCKERHPLLLKCVITTFLRCIWMAGQASNSICMPIMVHSVSLMPKNNSQISHKISDLGHPPSKGNGMLYCNEMHLLLLECFITFLRYIGMIGLASDRINETLMIHTLIFLPNTALNFQAKCQILRTI